MTTRSPTKVIQI